VLEAIIAAHSAPQMTLDPRVKPGMEVHLDKARDYACCEIAPIVKTSGEIAAQFYNTSGTSGTDGGCPPTAVNAKALAAKLGAAFVYMNPTPQTARRRWVMDQVWVRVGETVSFDGVAATWMALMTPKAMLADLNSGPYIPQEIHRATKYLYSSGSTVFLMHTPDKKTYVMQSYVSEIDPNLTFDQHPWLGSKLKLPPGWTFEAKILTGDLTIDRRIANNTAHIVRDELHDVYEGCGFNPACNYVP
jgi:hypothetical protein